jgi:hypothetical protein
MEAARRYCARTLHEWKNVGKEKRSDAIALADQRLNRHAAFPTKLGERIVSQVGPAIRGMSVECAGVSGGVRYSHRQASAPRAFSPCRRALRYN